jgi:hypothetical protein
MVHAVDAGDVAASAGLRLALASRWPGLLPQRKAEPTPLPNASNNLCTFYLARFSYSCEVMFGLGEHGAWRSKGWSRNPVPRADDYRCRSASHCAARVCGGVPRTLSNAQHRKSQLRKGIIVVVHVVGSLLWYAECPPRVRAKHTRTKGIIVSLLCALTRVEGHCLERALNNTLHQ